MKTKKLLSIVLALCMLLSVVPMMTFGANAEVTYVCYIDADKNGEFNTGDVKYETIADALTAAGANATTIRLISDVTENVKVGTNSDHTPNITLDLNGKTLQSTGTVDTIRHNAITNYATLTVTDTSASGSGKITGGTGTSTGKGSYGGGVFNGGGSFTMLGGTITDNYGGLGGGVANMYGGTFTMLGGTISCNTSGTNGGGVFNDGIIILGGTAKIMNNTLIDGTTANNLYLKNGKTVTIGSDGLSKGAIIGVTTETAPTSATPVQFTTNGENSDKYYFFSDNDTYGVKHNDNNGGYLELALIDYSSTPKIDYSAYLTLAKNIDIGITVAKNASSEVNITSGSLGVYANGEEVTLNDSLEGTLASVCPNEIGKTFGVAVEYDGVIVKGFTYSVAKYCASAFKAYESNNAKYAKLKDLCEAILNYGKYAEDYVNGNTASTLNEGHEANFDSGYSFTNLKAKTVKGSAGNANLTLGSKITLNFYVSTTVNLTNEDTITQNFFVLNDKPTPEQIDPKYVTVSGSDGNYTVSVELYAYQLATSYTLKLKGVDTSDFCITYGVYNYCSDVQGVGNETMDCLCKAIHNYSQAVQAYIG